MRRTFRGPLHLAFAGLVLAACGDSGPNEIIPGVDCAARTPVNLAPGAFTVINATTNAGCIRLQAAGANGAEHLVVALSAEGQEVQNGVFGPYALGSVAVGSASPPISSARRPPDPAVEFHGRLRLVESELARTSPRLVTPPARVKAVPPQLGDPRTFFVCANINCSAFVNVASTAAFVGPHGAIYLDNTVPSGGYNQADIDAIGALFDGPSPNMYEIDTTAFGKESDLDGNGVVVMLLTDAVNSLSGNCNVTGSVILGYFFGLDLVSDPNSNNGEVFYSMVPNPGSSTCSVSKAFAQDLLAPTFIHEFQHMISFKFHVLLAPPNSPSELTWLNEGLSHFAEELGGRVLPDARCPTASSCLSQFASGNLSNGFEYLEGPESHFLVYPTTSFGTLEERGASWLFVRWLADNYAADTLLGTDLTRALVQTTLLGNENVEAATGVTFQQLVAEWQMANYLEGRVGFTEPTRRLKYKTWDFRSIYSNPANGFPKPYPCLCSQQTQLGPDSTSGAYSRSGTLRAGSGRHIRVVQNGNQGSVDLQLKGDNDFATLVPRIAVIRIR